MELLTGVPTVRTSGPPSLESMFAEEIMQEYTPVIFTLATPAAERLCEKANVTFTSLLSAHANLTSINVPVRTAGEQSYRLQDFRVRILHSREIKQQPAEVAEELLTQLVSNASETASVSLEEGSLDLDALLKMAKSETRSSWFQNYAREFSRSLCFSDHEALDHPVACVLAVAAGEEDPVGQLRDLYSAPNLPSLLVDQIMDPVIHKHCVVLSDRSSHQAETVLGEVRGVFGPPNCAHLVVKEGESLSAADADMAARFVSALAVDHVIPMLEHKVREHNLQVAQNRKGLRNQIKNLMWFRKGKEEAAESPVGTYTYKSPESQLRVLADYSFFLRDFPLALSTYRLLATDYRSDKAWKHAAGAVEMSGVCLFLLNYAGREAETCLESAYSYYQRALPTGTRYATRTALWLVGMHKARNHFREAAVTLMRASLEESNLRAGVLLEQAAYAFLRAEPCMSRKYGFHMVLAGNRYNLSHQRTHAIRAYTSVRPVYEGRGWRFVSDHCNFTLGRLSAFLGDYAAAVRFFHNLLTSTHQSPAMQTTFLREFLYCVHSSEAEGGPPLHLPLPALHPQHVRVLCEAERTWDSPLARGVADSVWSGLEGGMVAAVGGVAVTTWLDAPKAKSGVEEEELSNTVVVGERVGVEVELHNPLHLPLTAERMRLVVDGEEGAVEVEEQHLTLEPSERVVVRLHLTPLREGVVGAVGVEWVLLSEGRQARARTDFDTKLGGSRKGKGRCPPQHRLTFRVLAAMPRLSLSLHGLPSSCLQGEVHRVVVKLTNPTSLPLTNLKLRTNQPAMLAVGQRGEVEVEVLPFLEDATRPVAKPGPAPPVFCFPEGTVVEGGGRLLWPLWLHTDSPGAMDLHLVLSYHSAHMTPSLPHRTLCATYRLQVEPTLEVKVHTRDSPCHLDAQLMGIHVANRHPTQTIRLRQLSCLGDRWKIAPLPPMLPDAQAGVVVGPGHTSSLFFHLREGKGVGGRDVGLGSEALLPLTSQPLLHFHGRRSEEEGAVGCVVVWEREGSGGSVGTHYVSHPRVGRGGGKVRWVLQGPSSLRHDFITHPLCQVPLRLLVRNCSAQAASVHVRLTDPSEMGGGWHERGAAGGAEEEQLAGPLPCSPYVWTGPTSPTLPTIPPGATTTIPLRAAVFSHGVFNLAAMRVEWTLRGKEGGGEEKGSGVGAPLLLQVLPL